MTYPYWKQGPYRWPTTFFYGVDDEKHQINQRSHVPFILLDIILAQWWCPVASSEALDLLHRAMQVVTYLCISMAIETASFVGVFVDCCLFACCPGSHWGNMEWVVAQWRGPVASGVALDMLHQAMHFVLQLRTAMAIETDGRQGTFECHWQFCHHHELSY